MKGPAKSLARNIATSATAAPANLGGVPSDRVYLSTLEFAKLVNCRSNSIRNKYSSAGEYNGIRPIKFGGRLLWPVAEIEERLTPVSARRRQGGRRRGTTQRSHDRQ
jgi:hypothetical protein